MWRFSNSYTTLSVAKTFLSEEQKEQAGWDFRSAMVGQFYIMYRTTEDDVSYAKRSSAS
jgi:hypothetical protein